MCIQYCILHAYVLCNAGPYIAIVASRGHLCVGPGALLLADPKAHCDPKLSSTAEHQTGGTGHFCSSLFFPFFSLGPSLYCSSQPSLSSPLFRSLDTVSTLNPPGPRDWATELWLENPSQPCWDCGAHVKDPLSLDLIVASLTHFPGNRHSSTCRFSDEGCPYTKRPFGSVDGTLLGI